MKRLLMERKCRRTFSGLVRMGTAVLLFMCVNLSAAHAQSAKQVTLNMQDVPLEKVIEEIKKQTGQNFLYTAGLFQGVQPVSVRATDENWETVLDRVLTQRSFTYNIKNGIVVITKRPYRTPSQTPIMAVKGKVVDTKGQPIPGATIFSQETYRGTTADNAGNFVLFLPKDATMFQASFVGMLTQYVKIEPGKEEYRIVLKENIGEIDDVVVTGYQTINRADMVGSYSKVKADDIKIGAYSTIDKMLQGQIAGMTVLNTSNRVGSSTSIEIRGTSTFLGNSSPLWVVDGIIQPEPLNLEGNASLMSELRTIIGNQVSWLNPADIESITVLKDASATAIYGSRASNGVIVITTKKATTDRVSVNYNGSVSITNRPNYGMFNMMNSQERMQITDEAINSGTRYQFEPIKQWNTYEGIIKMMNEGDISEAEYIARRRELETGNTDWLRLLTRRAVSHNHNVSVSGGTTKNNYRVSLSYTKENGQEIGNDNERYSANVALTNTLHKNVRLSAYMNGSVSNTSTFTGVNPFNYAISTSRAVPAYESDGSLAFYDARGSYRLNDQRDHFGYNVINERDNSGANTERKDYSFSLDLEWKIAPWLTYQLQGGMSISDLNAESYYLEKTNYIAKELRGYDYNEFGPGTDEFRAAILPYGGQLYTNSVSQRSYNATNMLKLSKTFKADHRLNAMLGFELRSTTEKAISNTVWGYTPDRGNKLAMPTPLDELVPIGNGQIPSDWGVFNDLYSNLNPSWGYKPNVTNFVSYFATVAYSFKNRYVLNANIRNDMSNRFGQNVNKRFDPNYSFGLSWDAAQEPWIRNNAKWVDMLRLRATYGIQGNALTNRSNELILEYGTVDNLYQQFTNTIYQLPNYNLSWEKTTTWNLGLDMGLFRAVNVILEYYSRESNAIVTRDIPYLYGLSTMDVNGGIIKNRGVEATVEFFPVNKKDLWLMVRLNASRNFNKAGDPVSTPTLYEFLQGSSSKILKAGYPVSGFWSFSYAGLSHEDGHPLFNLIDKETDVNMDPTEFLVYSGQSTPNFTGGLQIDFRYKSFLFSSNFSLLLGAKKRLPSPYDGFSDQGQMPSPEVNLSRDLLNRWKKPGDEAHTDIPGFITGSEYRYTLPNTNIMPWMQMWNYSDLRVVNGSFLRCQQLMLTWQMKDDWCKKLGLQRFQASFSVANPFVIASKRFDGFDPELSGQQVRARIFTFGLNIGF